MAKISTVVPGVEPASWTYFGSVARVVDGDTVDLDLELGQCQLGPINPGRLEDEPLRPAAGAAIDLGFHLALGLSAGVARLVGRFRFRLMGYNAPEVHGLEAPLGRRAHERLAELLPVGSRVVAVTYKGDAFGRWLADVDFNKDAGPPVDLVEQLLAEGWGVRWDGRGERPAFDHNARYPRPQA